jgi:hypothetical protein
MNKFLKQYPELIPLRSGQKIIMIKNYNSVILENQVGRIGALFVPQEDVYITHFDIGEYRAAVCLRHKEDFVVYYED